METMTSMDYVNAAIQHCKDLPSSRELSLVVTKLQEAKLWLQEYEVQESNKAQS